MLLFDDVDGGHTEVERRPIEAAQPVIAAGQIIPTVGDVKRHLAERDRHHREINPAAAHDQQPEQRARPAAEQHAHQHRQRCRGGEKLQRQPGPVGAETEIRRVPETHDAGEAEQDVERHRGEAQHQHAAGECRVTADQRQPERHRQKHGPDEQQLQPAPVDRKPRRERRRGGAVHDSIPSSPIRPRGRSTSTTAMMT